MIVSVTIEPEMPPSKLSKDTKNGRKGLSELLRIREEPQDKQQDQRKQQVKVSMKAKPSPQVKVIVKVNLPPQTKANVKVNPPPQQSVEDVNLNPIDHCETLSMPLFRIFSSHQKSIFQVSTRKELSVVTSTSDLVEVYLRKTSIY